ncbi:hypothetical protein [Granulicoccus phenolivorans]|uniref:hypothetical protein n=1 Tax=Granulicoccus phenolivorans TaxID=266854 RepID=UPI0004218652|nr:hypothetical protein [Granulicoccus phenolivorans]
MSTYGMQRAIFDHLRRLEAPDQEVPADQIRTEGYELTEAELAALSKPDVGQLYLLGTHPVLINAFCRANGWKKADYAVLFPEGLADSMRSERKARWLTS